MRAPLLSAFAAVAAVLSLLPVAVSAQAGDRSDDEWLEQCRRNGSYMSDGEDREPFCEVRVERLRPRGRLAVDGRQNGSVRVTGREGGEAVVHARISAQARDADAAQAIVRQVRIVTSGDSVYATGPDRSRGNSGWYVSYVVDAPRESDLVVVTHNGSVGVAGVRGRMDLSAQNGSMSLSEVGGDVRARTQNGALHVRLSGRQWSGRGLDAETRNGSVRLAIPDGYAARLETGTVNGGFNPEFPLTGQGRIGSRISTAIGGGGPPIRATTTTGSVTLRRR
jgi:hypothetical protein